MRDPWQILQDGGLPLAVARTGGRPGAGELAAATRDAIASAPTGREAEALAAFLLAWHHHWPTSFATAHAADAPMVLAWAHRHAADANRFLKLRRIAIANLATVL